MRNALHSALLLCSVKLRALVDKNNFQDLFQNKKMLCQKLNVILILFIILFKY